ncbi:MAG: hypothetical protein AB1646_20140 [Thermodesulfobacteriota bacterium]
MGIGPSWSLRDDEIRAAGFSPFASPAVLERLADRLRRDNSRRHGALVGSSRLEAAGAQRPDAPEVRNRASELKGYYTGHRNLLPTHKGLPDAQLFRWFMHRRLKKIDQTDLVVAERHTRAYLNLIPGGYFVTVPAGRTPDNVDGQPPVRALHYALPQRYSPSLLRVAVERIEHPQDLVIMMVAGRTHHLRVIPGAEAHSADIRLTLGEAGLEMLRRQRPMLDFSTLGGPFSVRFQPAPLTEALTYELPLPPEVKEILVWSLRKSPCPVRLNLQYRESNPFAMPECDYLAAETLLLRKDTPHAGLAKLLTKPPEQPAKAVPRGLGHLALTELASNDLESVWLPLVRLVRSHYTTFVTPVQESTRQVLAVTDKLVPLTPAKRQELERAAEEAESQTQWLVVLEKWGALFHGTSGKARAKAALKVAEMLDRMGDSYLAEMLLRRLYLQLDGVNDPECSREAYGKLRSAYARSYAQTADPDALLTLACVQTARDPNPANLRELASWLVETGHHELALLAGLALPPAQRPSIELLRAGKKLGWHQVCAQIVATLPDPAERHTWSGLLLLDQGRFPEASAALANGGPKGGRWGAAAATARAIQTLLCSPNPADRARGIVQWERLAAQQVEATTKRLGAAANDRGDLSLSAHSPMAGRAGSTHIEIAEFRRGRTATDPARERDFDDKSSRPAKIANRSSTEYPGPLTWTDEPAGITDYHGSHTVYSVPRDLYFRVYRATSSRPVRARFYGPLKVQVLVRPLHPVGSTQPLNGWLHVKRRSGLYITPITNNMPSQGLSVVGPRESTPGEEVVAVYDLEPGLQELQIHGGDIPLLVRVQAQRPECSLGILPPLTPETVDAALRGPLAPVPIKESARCECLGRTCLAVLPLANECKPVYRREELVRACISGARLSPVSDPSWWAELEKARQQHGVKRSEDQDRQSKQAQALAVGDFPLAWEYSGRNSPQDVLTQMAILVYWGERHPEKVAELEPRAQALFARNPQVPFLRGLLTRLSQKTSWELVTLVDSCAGMRILPVKEWQPESDAMRVRKAITQPVAQGERVVVGQDKLVLIMHNLKPTQVRMKFTLADVPFLPPAPLDASFQLDGGNPRTFTLTADHASRELSTTVPEGRHRLQVAIKARFANQFVRVRFCEPRSAGECLDVVLTKGDERTYYVATADRPLKTRVRGPAWVRMDELRGEDVRMQYRFFPEGWHQIVLPPEKGRREALFRVYKRVPAPVPEEVTIPRPVELHFAAVPDPLCKVSAPAPVEVVSVLDEYRLGRQQRGTWSVTGKYRVPKDIEEDLGGTSGCARSTSGSARNKDSEGDFLEFSATRRYFNEYRPAYYRTSLLTRFRGKGGPTLGIEADCHYYPRGFACAFHLEGKLFLQRPESGTFGFQGGPTAGSATLEAGISTKCRLTPKMYHIPHVSVFGRLMSMQTNTRFAVAGLDQDVFTSYKAEHQRGITISDALIIEPWLDTIWFVRGSATTNESLSPADVDNFKIQTGWKQLLGPFQADVVYRYSHFFPDADRCKAQDKHLLELDLTCDRWTLHQKRLQIQCKAEIDLSRQSYSGFLSLTWFMGEGRGWRDFRPGEVDFRTIRDRQVPQLVNNRIQPVGGKSAVR